MADPKGAKATMPADGAGVDARNMIIVAMEGLTKADRTSLEQELEEEMVEWWHRKLACFQKTRQGIVKKADVAAAFGTMVYRSSLSPEDLVQLVDVSVASMMLI
jgi:hypothetical protein